MKVRDWIKRFFCVVVLKWNVQFNSNQPHFMSWRHLHFVIVANFDGWEAIEHAASGHMRWRSCSTCPRGRWRHNLHIAIDLLSPLQIVLRFVHTRNFSISIALLVLAVEHLALHISATQCSSVRHLHLRCHNLFLAYYIPCAGTTCPPSCFAAIREPSVGTRRIILLQHNVIIY